MNEAARAVQLAALAKAIGWVSVMDKGVQVGTRQAIAWKQAPSQMSNDKRIVFDVRAGAAVSDLGYHSAQTGGTFYGSRELPARQPFATDGTYTLEAGDITEALA